MFEPMAPTQVAVALHGRGERLMAVALAAELLHLRRLVIAETGRFPELGRALYEGGPGRAIAGLAGALERWADRGLIAIAHPVAAATQFNWLITGEPVNRAMFFIDEPPMAAATREAHIAGAVRLFPLFWLTATPQVPESGQAAARAKGQERYAGFVEALGRRLAAGKLFTREVSFDVPADRSEADV
jgi:hypothetical protein